MILRVTHYGEPILRKKGKKIRIFNKALDKLAADMLETMYANEGIGLAAQQIDQDKMICVVDLPLSKDLSDEPYTYDAKQPPLELILPLILINPVVKINPGETSIYEEGCLSFPEIKGDVIRSDNMEVTFQDLKGAHHKIQSNGFLGRVVQHEVDHLNGILFIDHMDKEMINELKPELRKLKRQSREFLKNEKSIV